MFFVLKLKYSTLLGLHRVLNEKDSMKGNKVAIEIKTVIFEQSFKKGRKTKQGTSNTELV